MDKFVKRIQSRLQYKGLFASKQQCRDAYQVVVADLAAPTDEEINLVVENLAAQLCQGSSSEEIALPPAPPVDPTLEQNLIPGKEGQHALSTETPLEITSDLIVPDSAPLAPPVGGEMTVPGSAPLAPPVGGGITHQQIQEAVEQRFASSPSDIKAQVIQYASGAALGSAKELEHLLGELRQVEVSVMLQIISTHHTQRLQTLVAFRDALGGADAKRKEESQAFFAQFNQELAQMKAAFGVS